ncbi:MAG: CoA pyrophosphatase [Chloroflexota bacterium]|nr:CoA pyrophosphatase [Chloroflexota bacterium]
MDDAFLEQRLADPAIDGLWLRERLMPRWQDGSASRPIEPPPDAPPPRIGAVLLLLYPHNDALYLPLTVRTAALRTHSGEISLPGGRYDEADGDLSRTALREAWEELGIPPAKVTLWTQLTPVWIPVSNFQITPYVGWADHRPAFASSAAEVAELIEVPLDLLRQPETIRSEIRELRGNHMYIPFFAVGEHKVWGATALVLAEVVGKLEAPGP